MTHSMGSISHDNSEEYKRTKIIATVGTSTDSYEAILGLVQQGANGLLLDCGDDHAKCDQYIAWIRKASQHRGQSVAIIRALQGPDLRLGDFDGMINVQKGQSLRFSCDVTYEPGGPIPVRYDLSTKVKRGERLYLYDGKVQAVVTSVIAGIVHARAGNDGILIKGKRIHLPDTDFEGEIVTANDQKDLVYASNQDVDYVLLNFIQTADDVELVRHKLKNLGSTAGVIAKIDTKTAVDNAELITETADVVMVTASSLTAELSAEAVPIVQRQIIGLGHKYATPIIVAAALPLDNTALPEQAYAEVSDITTAVLVGADCITFSPESMGGDDSVAAVAKLGRIIRYAETNAPLKAIFPDSSDDYNRQRAMSDNIVGLAETMQATAIVAEATSVATALQLAARRPNIPVLAVTNDVRMAQQLALVYDLKSYVRPKTLQGTLKLTDWLRSSNILHRGDVVVIASSCYPGVAGATDTIKVRVVE